MKTPRGACFYAGVLGHPPACQARTVHLLHKIIRDALPSYPPFSAQSIAHRCSQHLARLATSCAACRQPRWVRQAWLAAPCSPKLRHEPSISPGMMSSRSVTACLLPLGRCLCVRCPHTTHSRPRQGVASSVPTPHRTPICQIIYAHRPSATLMLCRRQSGIEGSPGVLVSHPWTGKHPLQLPLAPLQHPPPSYLHCVLISDAGFVRMAWPGAPGRDAAFCLGLARAGHPVAQQAQGRRTCCWISLFTYPYFTSLPTSAGCPRRMQAIYCRHLCAPSQRQPWAAILGTTASSACSSARSQPTMRLRRRRRKSGAIAQPIQRPRNHLRLGGRAPHRRRGRSTICCSA